MFAPQHRYCPSRGQPMPNKIADDAADAVLVSLLKGLHFATTRRFGRFMN